MEKLPLSAVPNQSFSINLGDRLLDISILRGQSGSTLIDVSIDGVQQVSGLRCAHGADILFAPRWKKYGHLVFFCDDGASYPDYTKFGLTHNLYWWKE